jgi:hypothetical protein
MSRPDRLWGPLSHLCIGYQGLFPPVVKRLGNEIDHSLPSVAGETNLHFLHLRGVMLSWAQENFTFLEFLENLTISLFMRGQIHTPCFP